MAAWEFQELQNMAEKHGWHKCISMQNDYNLLYREEEHKTIPYCNYTGVGLVPWSSAALGALTRPYQSPESLREKTDNYLKVLVRSCEDKVDEEITNRVEEMAKKLGKSMAQFAIASCLSKKNVCSIVGLPKKERMDEAVEAYKIKLSEEETKYLEEPYIPRKTQGC